MNKDLSATVENILKLMYQLEDDTQYKNNNLSKAIDYMQKVDFSDEE